MKAFVNGIKKLAAFLSFCLNYFFFFFFVHFLFLILSEFLYFLCKAKTEKSVKSVCCGGK